MIYKMLDILSSILAFVPFNELEYYFEILKLDADTCKIIHNRIYKQRLSFSVEDECIVYRIEKKKWRLDGPAVEYPDGKKVWWVDECIHRVDGPAIEYPDGTKMWIVKGKLHREYGPAVEYADGKKEWWVNDHLYCADGSAM